MSSIFIFSLQNRIYNEFIGIKCVPVSQWAYSMLKFKQISMENVNTHIRMRGFPLGSLELVSLIWSECEFLSFSRSACVYVHTKESNAQSSD